MYNFFNSLVSPLRSIPGNNPAGTSVAQSVALDEQTRKVQMARAWAAYQGDLPEVLRVKLNQPNDNLLINVTRMVVDKGVSTLFGMEAEFSIEDKEVGDDDNEMASTLAQKADAYLENLWKANKKQTLLHNLGVNGAIGGCAFIKIVIEQGRLYPRLIAIDPLMVSVICNAEDWERVEAYTIEWNSMPADRTKPAIAYRQLIVRDGATWLILDQHSSDKGNLWVTDNETAWDYTWAPIFHCQNLPMPNAFWGGADISYDFLRLLQSRNFVASNINRILRYHAHPKTYATGIPSVKLEMSADDIVFLPNADAKLANLEMQGDLASSMAFLEYLDEQLMSKVNIPPVALGKVDTMGPISGVALKLHYQPLLERNATKRMLYGDMLCNLNMRLLELAGFVTDTLCCEMEWPDVLPTDTTAAANEALILDQLGIASKSTLATRLGFDYDKELTIMAEEKAYLANQQQIAFDRGQVIPEGDGSESGDA